MDIDKVRALSEVARGGLEHAIDVENARGQPGPQPGVAAVKGEEAAAVVQLDFRRPGLRAGTGHDAPGQHRAEGGAAEGLQGHVAVSVAAAEPGEGGLGGVRLQAAAPGGAIGTGPIRPFTQRYRSLPMA